VSGHVICAGNAIPVKKAKQDSSGNLNTNKAKNNLIEYPPRERVKRRRRHRDRRVQRVHIHRPQVHCEAPEQRNRE
jgi:hypothetical protein